jgi:hypothetical protein
MGAGGSTHKRRKARLYKLLLGPQALHLLLQALQLLALCICHLHGGICHLARDLIQMLLLVGAGGIRHTVAAARPCCRCGSSSATAAATLGGVLLLLMMLGAWNRAPGCCAAMPHGPYAAAARLATLLHQLVQVKASVESILVIIILNPAAAAAASRPALLLWRRLLSSQRRCWVGGRLRRPMLSRSRGRSAPAPTSK